MIFSRFTHTYSRDGVIAVFNSLRLRPVFLPKDLYEMVQASIKEGKTPSAPDSVNKLSHAIEELKKQKILIDSPSYDDVILQRFRNLTGKPQTRIAYFIMTDQCNFNCSYCFVRKEQRKGKLAILGKMSSKIGKKALETYARLSFSDDKDSDRMIIFYGGEPLLNFPVIKEIVLYAKELKAQNKLASDTKFAIVTNGSLLTDEIAAFFHEQGVGIGISVDGDSFVTNSSRVFTNGEPTFDSIAKGIETCRRNHCDDFSLSVTISEKCLENFDSTIDFIVNKVGCKNLGYNILMNMDCNTEDDPYSVDASKFLLKSFEIFRKKGIYEDRMMRKTKAFVDGKVHLFDCAACGANQVVFAPDGTIGVCHGFLGTKTFFSGNVFDDAFDPQTNPDFVEWSKRAPVNMEECLPCPAIGLCGGGCSFNAYQHEKTIWGLDRRFCTHSKMSLEWLIWDLYNKATSNQ